MKHYHLYILNLFLNLAPYEAHPRHPWWIRTLCRRQLIMPGEYAPPSPPTRGSLVVLTGKMQSLPTFSRTFIELVSHDLGIQIPTSRVPCRYLVCEDNKRNKHKKMNYWGGMAADFL